MCNRNIDLEYEIVDDQLRGQVEEVKIVAEALKVIREMRRLVCQKIQQEAMEARTGRSKDRVLEIKKKKRIVFK